MGGAPLAILEGYAAGRALSRPPVDDAVLRRIAVHRRFARSMHAVHAPRTDWVRDLPDGELVCRCEEVSAGEVRGACRELGVDDVRAVEADDAGRDGAVPGPDVRACGGRPGRRRERGAR